MKKPNIKKIYPPKFSERKLGRVKCAIFQSRNEIIERFTTAINEAKSAKEKTYLAGRLKKEAEKLLSCQHFDKKRVECKICQYIANLWKKTANLIAKIKNYGPRNYS